MICCYVKGSKRDALLSHVSLIPQIFRQFMIGKTLEQLTLEVLLLVLNAQSVQWICFSLDEKSVLATGKEKLSVIRLEHTNDVEKAHFSCIWVTLVPKELV